MRVLISGGSGQIGRYVRRLLERDHQVVVLSRSGDPCRLQPTRGQAHFWECDITDEASVKDACWLFQPELILHLAGIATVKVDEESPCEISRCNVLGTHHLLAHSLKGARFLLASSATVYGNNTSKSMPATESILPTPVSVYAATKLAQEALVEAYTRLGLVSGCSLRLCASVGSGTRHGLLHDIIRKLNSSSNELELIGDEPGSVKPFLYAGDIAQAFAHFGLCPTYESTFEGQVNITSGDSATVLDVARAAMKGTGITKPIRWLGQAANWAGDNPKVFVDGSLARRLGFSPCYSFSVDAVEAAVFDIVRGR